jgi:xanthine dehydrogenase accessory factor
MDGAGGRHSSAQLTKALARVLRDGRLAALATLVEAPTEHASRVGAKILLEENGELTGSTGDAGLDTAVAEQARAFLGSRSEARTFAVAEFAPALEGWRGGRVLFERVEPEPHVVVCGAGHVGASLARLARAVGYRVTLIDDRADFVAPERFPEGGITLVAAREWAGPLKRAVATGRGVSVAVVTRGHNEDEECLRRSKRGPTTSA